MSTPHPSLSLLPKLHSVLGRGWKYERSKWVVAQLSPLRCVLFGVWVWYCQGIKEGRREAHERHKERFLLFFFLEKVPFHPLPLLSLIWSLFQVQTVLFLSCAHCCCMPPCMSFFCSVSIFVIIWYTMAHGSRQLKENYPAQDTTHILAHIYKHKCTHLYTPSAPATPKKKSAKDRRIGRWTPNESKPANQGQGQDRDWKRDWKREVTQEAERKKKEREREAEWERVQYFMKWRK